jgi:ribulose-phosphate 3-epimerase
MSVHPGFSGQSFIESTLDKVRAIRKDFSGDIKVDGGVNATNAPALIAAGATVLITASYLFGSENYSAAIKSLII